MFHFDLLPYMLSYKSLNLNRALYNPSGNSKLDKLAGHIPGIRPELPILPKRQTFNHRRQLPVLPAVSFHNHLAEPEITFFLIPKYSLRLW